MANMIIIFFWLFSLVACCAAIFSFATEPFGVWCFAKMKTHRWIYISRHAQTNEQLSVARWKFEMKHLKFAHTHTHVFSSDIMSFWNSCKSNSVWRTWWKITEYDTCNAIYLLFVSADSHLISFKTLISSRCVCVCLFALQFCSASTHLFKTHKSRIIELQNASNLLFNVMFCFCLLYFIWYERKLAKKMEIGTACTNMIFMFGFIFIRV